MKIIYFSFLFLLVFSCCKEDDNPSSKNSFKGETAWVKTFGGTQDEFATSVITTSNNNIAIVGTTKSINGDVIDHSSEQNDVWFLLLDQEGNIITSKTFGGTDDDQGQSIIETSDGGFAITGYTRSSDEDVTENNGLYDYWMIKLSNNGDLEWEKSFGFAGIDQAYEVIQTNDNGYLISGYLDVSASGGLGNDRSNQHGIGEFWLVKLNASGTKEWRRYFGGSSNDRAYDVIETNSGDFIAVGSTESTDFDISNHHGEYDFWVIKVNNSGDLVWEKTFGGSGIEVAHAIIENEPNKYIIVGDSRSTDQDLTDNYGNADVWFIQIDGNANLLNQNNIGGTKFDTSRGITRTENGFAIAATSQSDDIDTTNNYSGNDFWVIQCSNSGEILYQKNFGGTDFDFAYDITENQEKGLIIVGDTQSSDLDIIENKGLKDILVVKIN